MGTECLCAVVGNSEGDKDQGSSLDMKIMCNRLSRSQLLPPGFRFHPTDQELVWFYLWRRLQGNLNVSRSIICKDEIAELDLYKLDPWDLPGAALHGDDMDRRENTAADLTASDHRPAITDSVSRAVHDDIDDEQYTCDDCREGYYFHRIDRKYPRGKGTRANRATPSGYWKATGRDRQVNRPSAANSDYSFTHEYKAATGIDQKTRLQNLQAYSGWKKTLVFYRGRAPKGDRTDWVMHEFYISCITDDHLHHHHHDQTAKQTVRDDVILHRKKPASELLVLCRVMQKRGLGPQNHLCSSPANPQANIIDVPHHQSHLTRQLITTHQFLPPAS